MNGNTINIYKYNRNELVIKKNIIKGFKAPLIPKKIKKINRKVNKTKKIKK